MKLGFVQLILPGSIQLFPIRDIKTKKKVNVLNYPYFSIICAPPTHLCPRNRECTIKFEHCLCFFGKTHRKRQAPTLWSHQTSSAQRQPYRTSFPFHILPGDRHIVILKLYTASGSCDRASLTQEKKEPTDDTSKDVYSLLAQHVSGIIMPIVRRQTE